jgi:hypothetical protein
MSTIIEVIHGEEGRAAGTKWCLQIDRLLTANENKNGSIQGSG